MGDAAAALRRGETSSVALTEASIAGADALDERLGVYVTRFDDHALERADAADRELAAGTDRGPLHGMPIGVKDILAMREGPTTAQSLILDDAWGRDRDAIVVERLKAAGAVITGKTTTMEFAVGAPDPDKPFPLPRNPWDLERYTGGSSSGTANGVAAGLMVAGVGTDTGGSIRCPAAFCGVTGLMPTYGRVPNAGCVPLGWSLDRIGPLARSARDCGDFLAAIAGPDPRDPYAVERPLPAAAGLDGSLAGLRVGVERANHFGGEEDPATAPVFDAAAAELEALGASVVEVVIPHYAEACTALWVTMVAEALAYHRGDLAGRWDDYFASTRLTVGSGALVSAADYVQAQRVRRVAQRGLSKVFETVDLIAMPSSSKPAMTLDQLAREDVGGMVAPLHLMYWNAVGNPTLVVPMGFTADQLPLSLQLAAPPFGEAALVRAGDAYQRATDWHLRVPPVSAARLSG